MCAAFHDPWGIRAGIGFLIAVGIPACGYFGAKRKDRGLLCKHTAPLAAASPLVTLACPSLQRGFGPVVRAALASLRRFAHTAAVCADLTCVILFIISAIVLFGVSLPALECYCNQECRQDNDISSDDDGEQKDIEDVCSREDDIRQLYYVGFGIGLVMAMLQCAGVVYGRELAHHSYFVTNHAGANAAAFVPTAQPVHVQAQRVQPMGHPQQHPQQHQGQYEQPAASSTGYHAPLYDTPGAGAQGQYGGGYAKTAS